MINSEDQKIIKKIQSQASWLGVIVVVLSLLVFWVGSSMPIWNIRDKANDSSSIISSEVDEYVINPDQIGQIDPESGLIMDHYWELAKSQCTGCHSAALVIQTKASRDGWKEMITWMQKSQNLWDLGENENYILDYLEKNYGMPDPHHLQAIHVDEWYEIK